MWTSTVLDEWRCIPGLGFNELDTAKWIWFDMVRMSIIFPAGCVANTSCILLESIHCK